MQHRLLLLIGILLFTFSCGKEESSECTGICTADFRSITVKVIDSEENPVVLDSINITDITNDRHLALNSGNQFEDGMYNIFNDSFVSRYKNQKIDLLFRGFINEELLIEETYKVAADCCHVYHISGPLKIVLD